MSCLKRMELAKGGEPTGKKLPHGSVLHRCKGGYRVLRWMGQLSLSHARLPAARPA